MTDPNPLKQAAEEAKARKLAEVQREQEVEARQTSERERMIREAVAPSFEVIGGPFHIVEGSESFDNAITAHGLTVLPDVGNALQRLYNTSPDVNPSVEFYIIRPREGNLDMPRLLEMLDADDVQIATVKDLIALDWKPSSEQDVLYAAGYSSDDDIVTAVRGNVSDTGVRNWLDYDYPGNGWSPGTQILVCPGGHARARIRAAKLVAP